MGAGKADPESISKDVIFPNYEWPELAKVQQQWNVTTFVVLSQKVIKSMNAGKSKIVHLLYLLLCFSIVAYE